METARAIEKSMQVAAPTTLSAHSRSFSPSDSSTTSDREETEHSYRSVSLDSSYTHGSSGTASMDMVHSPKATLDMDINASPFNMPDQDEVGSDGTALTDAEMADFDAFLISQSTDNPSKSKDASAWPDEGLWQSVKYLKFLASATAEWEAVGPSKARHCKSLYCFWGYRLRKNYDAPTYVRFKNMVLKDAESGTTQRHRYGLETLCRFYSYGLEIQFQDNIFSDFQSVTLQDHERGHVYAVEKFWAFLHYNQNQHASKVSPKLEAVLSAYTCIEDFKPAAKSQQWARGGLSNHKAGQGRDKGQSYGVQRRPQFTNPNRPAGTSWRDRHATVC